MERIPQYACLSALILAAPVLFAQAPEWPSQLRALASSGRVDEAMERTEDWIRRYPQDVDARAWHARILGWQGKWEESEREFRSLLEQFPRDPDLLMGLAHVLSLRNRREEALELLDRACDQAPPRPDCRAQKAHTLALLGRTREAKALYRSLLGSDSVSRESRAALEELNENGRHQLRIGGEAALVSYTRDGGAVFTSLTSRWNQRWQTAATFTQYRRFGVFATGVDAATTYRVSSAGAVSIGGGSAGSSGIAPRAIVFAGYEHGFRYSIGPIRGLEAGFEQKWIWYPGTRILTYAPGLLVQLPKTWDCSLRFTAARIADGAAHDWNSSVQARVTFPLHRRYRGHFAVASGAENFGTIDQILFRSSRTAGGGIAIRLMAGQEFHINALYEAIAGGRSLTVFGGAYAVRF